MPDAGHVSEALLVSRRPLYGLMLVVAGLAVARFGEMRHVMPWILLGVIGLIVFLACRVRSGNPSMGRPATIGLCLAVFSLAVAWGVLRDDRVGPRSIAAFVEASPQPWRVEGRIASAPIVRTPGRGGSMSQFGYQGPATYFRFSVDTVIDRRARRLPLRGEVLVRLDGPEYRLRIGDRLMLDGRLASFPPPHNPGDTDRAALARTQGLAGFIAVPSLDALEFLDSQPDWRWRLRATQARLRSQAAAWIRQDLPESDDTRRDALLAAILLGERGPGLEGLDRAFTRVGLAHLLAISGLHLMLLTATAALFLRLFNPTPNFERLMLAGLVVLYLIVVPARIPVWRASLMVLAFLAAGAAGRRLDAINVWAIAALILLIWRPSELVEPGAHLSFGIVLALITLTRPLRDRLFAPASDTALDTPGGHAIEQLRLAVAVTLVAWLVSTPIVAFHFGAICPLAALAALPALALAAIILAAGYLKALTAVAFPSVGVVLATPLAFATDGLIGFVDRLDRLPLSSVAVGHPGFLWTILAVAAVAWWLRIDLRGRWLGRVRLAVLIVLALWLMCLHLPAPAFLRDSSAQVTMIAVGHGSCFVVESGGEVFMYDAGSGSYLGIGDASIIPTLRRCGILEVPTIILSHGDLDHFSAALEVMSAKRTRTLIVNTPLLDRAASDPLGPTGYLIAEAERLGVRIVPYDADATMPFGGGTLAWLHPDTSVEYRIENETSSVVRFDIHGRRVLFTGDLQSLGIATLLENHPPESLRADVIELPHHGGWSDAAAELVEVIDPSIILQSANPFRLRADRWPEVLGERQRYITAVHGATRITIARDGTISVTTHRTP